MRRVVALSMLLGVLPAVWQGLEACGDKFLLVGRGAKFSRAYAAIYPANILIYAHAPTAATMAIKDPRFRTNLVRAGHTVAMVEDRERLEQALRAGTFDIVLADVDEAPALAQQVAAAPSKPTVLYMTYQHDQTELKRLQAQYNCPLKATDKPATYLTVIDDQMKAREGTSRRARTGH